MWGARGDEQGGARRLRCGVHPPAPPRPHTGSALGAAPQAPPCTCAPPTRPHTTRRRAPQAPRTGLRTPFRGRTLQAVAKDAVAMARGGLTRRGLGEESFLQQLEVIADTGLSQVRPRVCVVV